MNQKTAQGQRLIDQAKTAVENFINKVRDKNKKKPAQKHRNTNNNYSFLTERENQTRISLHDTKRHFALEHPFQ